MQRELPNEKISRAALGRRGAALKFRETREMKTKRRLLAQKLSARRVYLSPPSRYVAIPL